MKEIDKVVVEVVTLMLGEAAEDGVVKIDGSHHHQVTMVVQDGRSHTTTDPQSPEAVAALLLLGPHHPQQLVVCPLIKEAAPVAL
jgi:hypothetical protein